MSYKVLQRFAAAICMLAATVLFGLVSQSSAQCLVVIKKNVKVPWTVYKNGEVRNTGWFMFTDTPRNNARLIIQYAKSSDQEINLFGDYGKNWVKITNTTDNEIWDANADNCEGNVLRGHIIREGRSVFDFALTTAVDTPEAIAPPPPIHLRDVLEQLAPFSVVEGARYHDSRPVVNFSEAPRPCKGRGDERCYAFSRYTVYVEPDAGRDSEVIMVYNNLNPMTPHFVLRDTGKFYGILGDKLFVYIKTDEARVLEVFNIHSKRSIHKAQASEPIGIQHRDNVVYYTEKGHVDNITACPNKKEAFDAKRDGLDVIKEVEVRFNMIDMSITPTGVLRCAGRY
ncbi:MAG: hypothetical protein HQL06_07340 [Nitrospirae bacterium]|nr:hypothetical protein [Nitrospirota bacterium]